MNFEQLIREAVRGFPPSIKRALDNVAFVVEDDDANTPKRVMGLTSSQSLLGLYEGVSKRNRGVHYAGVLPDKISIFRKPIEESAGGDPTRLRRLVKEVVWHEVGHHLGFSDRELRAIERKKRRAV
jgi:predicted Zn-dependent protease with MMP-like domain